MEAKINEIFSSIQGEGTVVGCKQIFVRFCECNLNCKYCDTKFQDGKTYTPAQLFETINKYDLKTFHSISLTGGEPLLSAEFLKDFLPLLKEKIKIYLETNATLPDELNKIKNYTDIIAADIKLPSSTGFNTFKLHQKFFDNCKGTTTFAKVVFDENITQEEINICCEMGAKNDIELILQPKMSGDKMSVSSDFCVDILEKFTQKYPKVRLIPQVHKFLDVI